MYRKIRLDKADQAYHTIFWRKDPKEELREYQLTTVTFGTAAAPFLATRTLGQLAENHQEKYPLASEIIRRDFYVDDLISGSSTIKDAKQAKDELIRSLQDGDLSLRKWSSNNQELLESLPPELTERSLQSFAEDDSTKALGLRWNPRSDKFSFQVSWNVEESQITKRRLLSEASKLFDPLGWLAPTIINAKLLMQEVWASKISWDEEVPENVRIQWMRFREELPLLGQISVDRWIDYENSGKIELHGFCDASEKAYAAVVYTRIQQGNNVKIKLITSKTRVAPLNMKTTLPRLELCGAVLLANLLKSTKEALDIGDIPTIAWSDSMITLGWLNGAPGKWKTFVANRVADVNSTRITDWRYIKSEDNPADCASRGLMPGELKGHELWWTGPQWLKQEKETWPKKVAIEEVSSEQKVLVANVATVERSELLLGSASWSKMVRVLAYVRQMKKGIKQGPHLTLDEIEAAKTTLYKRCQQETFPDEICRLQNGRTISTKSRILSLNPFLDEQGVMRVGGRLQNSVMSFNNKHPIILSPEHETTKAIVHQKHLDTLHGGPQLMVNLLRKRYWIINAKRLANNEFQRCVNCKRFNGRNHEQIMGNLPKERVTLERAFLHVGLDYAGPVEILASRLRKAAIQKGYIAIFVCLGTRAVHLELVSDMTTTAFMATFNRFLARRGLCSTMYSDNGSNFVGAANQLASQERKLIDSTNKEVAALLINRGINWKFIPPGSPNFGGIWERGVRSIKEHLKRTLKMSKLTFEEYGTVLCQIEACLNSRPLCPLTSDQENLNALTPGNFLIVDALMAPPQPILLDITKNQVHRWNHLQLLKQHFWTRWQNEYLTQLQQREKWRLEEENLEPGDMILVKDEQLPPMKWLLGIIVKTHPGADNKIRVATIKTVNGFIKRPVSKICPMIKAEQTSEVVEHEEDEEERFERLKKGKKSEKKKAETRSQPVQKTEKKKSEVQKMGKEKMRPTQLAALEKSEPTPTGSRGRYSLRPRGPPTWLMVAAMFGLLLMVGGVSTQQSPVKITKFNHSAGMYLEDLGRASIVKTEWHMYVSFSLSTYMYEFKRLQDVTRALKKNCAKINSGSVMTHCEDVSALLIEEVAEINRLNELIKSNGDKDHFMKTRKRSALWDTDQEQDADQEKMIEGEQSFDRAAIKEALARSLSSFKGKKKRAAPLNFVGWIQHEAFGIMAAEQAEEIEEKMEKAKLDRDHLKMMIKNQTSIMQSTLDNMQASQADINLNYDKIEAAIEQLANKSSTTQKREQLTDLALYANIFVHRFGKIQRNILDMLTDVQQGHISSYVFTPQQFQAQLHIINSNLPIGTAIPDDSEHDIKTLYKIVRGSARVTEKNILVNIVIPLVSTIEYQVFHVISVPTRHPGSMVAIVPDSKYLLITLKRDNFYQMDNEELNTCLSHWRNAFICRFSHPVYNAQSHKSQCERDLLTQESKLSPWCKVQVTKEEDFWIQLHENNHWIYGIKERIMLNIVCKNEVFTSALEGSGILELQPDCEIIQPNMTITSVSSKTSEGQFNFFPSLNLSEAVINAGENQEFDKINLTLDHTQHMNTIYKAINELKEQSDRELIHHSTHYILSTSFTFGIIITILLIWYKKQWFLQKFRHYLSTQSTSNNDDVELGSLTTPNVIQATPRRADSGWSFRRSAVSKPIVKVRENLNVDYKIEYIEKIEPIIATFNKP